MSAGLIALGFQSGAGSASAATSTFEVVVLSSLAFPGIVTFLRCQLLLSVAGTIGVVASIVLGADAGALAYGLHLPLGAAIGVGVLAGLAAVTASIRFQRARWRGAGAA